VEGTVEAKVEHVDNEDIVASMSDEDVFELAERRLAAKKLEREEAEAAFNDRMAPIPEA